MSGGDFGPGGFPGASEYDLRLRGVQALEKIAEQLTRLHLQEGPCESYFQRQMSGNMEEWFNCSLRHAHTGPHSAEDSGYGSAKWWSPEDCEHEWRVGKRDHFIGNRVCDRCGSWRVEPEAES